MYGLFIAALAQIGFALYATLQKWVLKNYDVSAIQLALWCGIGSTLLGVLYISFIQCAPHLVVPPSDPKLSILVAGMILLAAISGVITLYSYKISNNPEVLGIAVLANFVAQYFLAVYVFEAKATFTSKIGLVFIFVGSIIFIKGISHNFS